ncbi:hypothetical protein [Pleurochrysis sp. Polinton-like virus]|nr:hypothetical protein [Pleurochrysis sp. Polinton-like virus]
MPKLKQPKTNLVEDSTNLMEDTANHVENSANHAENSATHADDDEMRKRRIAEIRAKWTATREANKKRERAKEEEVRSTLTTLKQETENVKTKLSETTKYENEIEALRRDLTAAISELKQEKKRARTLKRVEIYGDDDEDDHEVATRHAKVPQQPPFRQGAHTAAPPSHRPPAAWRSTSWVSSENPFNTY